MVSSLHFYWVGTIVSIDYMWEGEERKREFMLVERCEEDHAFQLVSLSDYKRGRVFAYISMDPVAVRNKAIGVTREHLVRELVRVFGESVKVLDIRSAR